MELTKELRESLERHLVTPTAHYAKLQHPQLEGAEVHETPDGPLIYKRNGAKVLAVAHLDWVTHAVVGKPKWLSKKPVREYTYSSYTPGICYYLVDERGFRNFIRVERPKKLPKKSKEVEVDDGPKHIMHYGSLDDRQGLWIILEVLPLLGIEVDILLTDSEESGASTAKRFKQYIKDYPQYNWLIEFDRRDDDVVFYGNESDAWRKAWEDVGIKIGNGSYTDISSLDWMDVCMANLGIYYYNQHSTNCHADIQACLKRLEEKFLPFWKQHKDTRFESDDKPEPIGYAVKNYWTRRGGAGGGTSWKKGKKVQHTSSQFTHSSSPESPGVKTEKWKGHVPGSTHPYLPAKYRAVQNLKKLEEIKVGCPQCGQPALHESGLCNVCDSEALVGLAYLDAESDSTPPAIIQSHI